MTGISGAFGKPFTYQLAAYRLRLANLVPTSAWDDLWQSAHDRAFMVAGATKADLLADLAAAIDKAISEGTTLETFRKDFRAIVEKRGWHGWTGEGTKGGEAWRTKVIYQTNMATSYAAGRWAQLREAGFPFLIYHHGNSLEPRHQHLAWDGLVLEADHPFWTTHAPPNGWGCSCYVSGARTRQSSTINGGKPEMKLPDGWQALDPRTGAPIGIDRGWAYAPGATAVDDIIALVNSKAERLPEALASSLLEVAVAGPSKSDVAALVKSLDDRWDAEDTASFLSTYQKSGIAALTESEALAIYSYSVRTFSAVNHAARQRALGRASDPEALRLLEIIETALQRLPAIVGSTVRGITDPSTRLMAFFEKAPIGTQFSFEGLTSTSYTAEKAFSGPIQFFIRGKTGRDITKLSRFPDKEDEILLRSGLQFTILARMEKDGVLMIEVEELRRHAWIKLPLEALHGEQLG